MGVIATFFPTFGMITTLTFFPGCWYIIQELKYAMAYSYGKRVFVVLRPIMDRKRTEQVFKLDRNVSIRVAILMGRYAKRLQLSSNEYCQACGSAAFHFLCQCLFLVKYRFRLFGCCFSLSITREVQISIIWLSIPCTLNEVIIH